MTGKKYYAAFEKFKKEFAVPGPSLFLFRSVHSFLLAERDKIPLGISLARDPRTSFPVSFIRFSKPQHVFF